MQIPSSGITYPIEILRHSKNHSQLGPDSLFTTAKARGKTLLLASVAITINNTPIYHTNESHQYWSLACNIWMQQCMEWMPKIHSVVTYYQVHSWVWYYSCTRYPNPNPSMPIITFATFGMTVHNPRISLQLPFVLHPIPYSKKAHDHTLF